MRNRNIKLNVYLNEEEKNMLKRKANKAVLSQSDFIRQLIYDYIDFNDHNININSITNNLLDIKKDLLIIKEGLHKMGYLSREDFLEKILYNLSKVIANELEIHI